MLIVQSEESSEETLDASTVITAAGPFALSGSGERHSQLIFDKAGCGNALTVQVICSPARIGNVGKDTDNCFAFALHDVPPCPALG
jgi:hypothetical protein